MKKVAIVTTHSANNFGAVLQAFSLVSACRELGADAKILDWRCPYYEWLYHRAWRMYRNPIPAVKHLLTYWGIEAPARRAFNQFRELIPLTPKITSRSGLVDLDRIYDAFIVGSDQVWNPANSAVRNGDFDRANLLDFVRTKPKYAYAASIGVPEIQPENLLPEFVSAWRSFSRITMREHEGAEYVKQHSGVSAEVVLDPVLLHDRSFWDPIAHAPRENKGAYLFLYNVKHSSSLMRRAERIAIELGLSIVNVYVPAQSPIYCGKTVSIGPAEFLGYLRDAAVVVTNSFHATAFSVLYGKKTYNELSKSAKSPNSRFVSLLRFAGLKSVVDEEVADSAFVSFDCSSANLMRLQQARIRSLGILQEMVS